MVAALVVSNLTLFVVVAVAVYAVVKNRKKAQRYAVTLKHNEGAFIGLCVKRRSGTWTFVDVRIQPTNPGGPVVAAAPGELHVPYPNILYYQEIQETANAIE